MPNLQQTKEKITPQVMPSKFVMGCPVNIIDFKGAFEYFKNSINSNSHAHIITINPEMIMYAQKDATFKQILNEANLIIPDGIGVAIALKILGISQSRITGIDFSTNMLSYCAEKNLKVALIGAAPNVIENAVLNLQLKHKGLNIVFAQNGYFTQDDELQILKKLEDCSPDLLLVGLGSPKQEKLIYNYKKNLKSTIMIGVGGSFDVFAGKVKRAPKIFQKTGLEWLYRLAIEPSRFKRMFPTLPLFLIKTALAKHN